jgi:hypothetical protein
MEGFNRQSRQSIYFDISYVIAREWPGDAMRRLEFQKSLAEKKLDFCQVTTGQRDMTLVRVEQSPLQVKTASLGPQVSGIWVISENPVYALELFGKEADAACEAYRQTWPGEPVQILQCSARIRHLYSCQEHAFKYLWEDRLGQKPEDFHYLGKRPVLGGGLRLVMPPVKEDTEPIQIEIKIESFFRESKKMFIETFFLWPKPVLLAENAKFDNQSRLKTVEKYAAEDVCRFLLQNES